LYGVIAIVFLAINIPAKSVPVEQRKPKDSFNTVAFTFAFVQVVLLAFSVVRSEQARQFALSRAE
jgi:hypothetical protein